MPIFRAGKIIAGSIGNFMTRLIYPPCCPICRVDVNDYNGICARCWKEAFFFPQGGCCFCGVPIIGEAGYKSYVREENADDDMMFYSGCICEDCNVLRPLWNAGRSVSLYAGATRALVLQMKHAGREDIAPMLGTWMVRSAEDLLLMSDWLIPVPLDNLRMIKRRYNQSALVAKAVARITGCKVAYDALRRDIAYGYSRSRTKEERFKSAKGVFTMNYKWRSRLEGKSVMLIDDVLTTGATMSACTEILLRYNVSQVFVLVVCRTVLHGDIAEEGKKIDMQTEYS
mgnify:CR=1 FL=1